MHPSAWSPLLSTPRARRSASAGVHKRYAASERRGRVRPLLIVPPFLLLVSAFLLATLTFSVAKVVAPALTIRLPLATLKLWH